jgi:hypothetical protein
MQLLCKRAAECGPLAEAAVTPKENPMRFTKILGLAVIVASAVMAMGASSASADTLCEENVGETGTCPAALRALTNSKIAGLATGANLLGNGGEKLLTCASETLGEITRTGGDFTLLAKITKLAFTKCTGPCTEANGLHLSYLAEANATSLDELLSSTGGNPGFVVEGCPFGVKCEFETVAKPVLLSASGDTLVASKVPLKLVNPGLCSIFAVDGFWDASYLMTLDPKVGEHVKPLFLVDKP